jgi:hypothetical protein
MLLLSLFRSMLQVEAKMMKIANKPNAVIINNFSLLQSFCKLSNYPYYSSEKKQILNVKKSSQQYLYHQKD